MEIQSYKIYFNDSALVIADSPDVVRGLDNLYFIGDDELQKSFKILLLSQHNGKPLHFALICPDPESTIRQFIDDFKVIQAAGGLVFNKENQLLTIKRKGYWDLPKGKIERDEDQKTAALREVMEETGITTINISDKICNTFHAYYEEDKLVLKQTHWFLMKSLGKGNLKPQVEEGISEVKFANLEWFNTPEFNSYQSVHDVLRSYSQNGITTEG
ncbi:MAG: hypothetical protein CK532_00020 [Flavobacteriales bacterium]|nr:NUDIX domain-containing protein [Flavobacteriaceae bacterium]PHX93086.1 MAG: hypothetical protein CK532_00020 [Flavobacteriales bacterium]